VLLQITFQATILELTPPPGLRDEFVGLCGQCSDSFRYGGTPLRIEPLSNMGKKVDPKVATEFGNSWLTDNPV
jgi:hypothetical protein